MLQHRDRLCKTTSPPIFSFEKKKCIQKGEKPIKAFDYKLLLTQTENSYEQRAAVHISIQLQCVHFAYKHGHMSSLVPWLAQRGSKQASTGRKCTRLEKPFS